MSLKPLWQMRNIRLQIPNAANISNPSVQIIPHTWQRPISLNYFLTFSQTMNLQIWKIFVHVQLKIGSQRWSAFATCLVLPLAGQKEKRPPFSFFECLSLFSLHQLRSRSSQLGGLSRPLCPSTQPRLYSVLVHLYTHPTTYYPPFYISNPIMDMVWSFNSRAERSKVYMH